MGNGRSIVEEGLFEITLTRRVAAPRELVFQAWTDAKHLAEWFGPTGFTNPVCEVDARVGGAIRVHLCAPDGVVYLIAGRFLEIDRPHRLVFMELAMDSEGRLMFELLNTVSFDKFAVGTEISVVARVIRSSPSAPQYLAGMSQGWSQSLDRLASLVARL
jgi:uncharacterized protein YndB with AHSA1/START domain